MLVQLSRRRPVRPILMNLPGTEKLELIDLLWESICDDPSSLPMSDELVEELDRRKAALEADPSSGITWGELKQRLGNRDGCGL